MFCLVSFAKIVVIVKYTISYGFKPYIVGAFVVITCLNVLSILSISGWQVEQAVRDCHKSFIDRRNEELRVSHNF